MADQTTQKAKSLRVIAPQLYKDIINAMTAKHNIHSYDIQATAIEKKDGLTIILRFGEEFAHTQEAFFTHETIKDRGEELNQFIQETADICKDVMVKDYFKMMKP
ncbi:hypothetical protein JNUCC1_00535 [Lentibacillus sp. JNUCC-1]|uniref:hypothetical protein n=1 Tax=Lentibacillus sp. JNUCC-1 TaxID=2654513 RepID=UPI0012E87B8E|nr:hypothetical protein [Lentibacillus sp. JNUCC-1]MUV36731.1 hypothetical protein [Lentibacillus sp. JNUCC-1]